MFTFCLPRFVDLLVKSKNVAQTIINIEIGLTLFMQVFGLGDKIICFSSSLPLFFHDETLQFIVACFDLLTTGRYINFHPRFSIVKQHFNVTV